MRTVFLPLPLLPRLELAYVHVVEPRVLGNVDAEGTVTDSIKPFRQVCVCVCVRWGGGQWQARL